MSPKPTVALLGAVMIAAGLALSGPAVPARSDPLLPLPSPTLPSLDPGDPLPDPGDLLPSDGSGDPGGDVAPVDPGSADRPEGEPPSTDGSSGKQKATPRPADPKDPAGDRYPHPPFAPIRDDPQAALLQRLYDAQATQRGLRNRIHTVQTRLSGVESTVKTLRANLTAARRDRDLAASGMQDRVLAIYKSGASYGLYVTLQPGGGPGRLIRGGADLAVLRAAGERVARIERELTEAVATRDGLAADLSDLRARLKQSTALVAGYLSQVAIQIPDTDTVGGPLGWPVRGKVTSGYGNRYDPWYRSWQLHAGIDIAAAAGTPVRSAAAGTVTQAGWFGGYGNYVCVAHGTVGAQQLTTCYGHQAKLLVTKGTRVRAGQPIGRVGSTGASTGPHLHFEVRLGGRPTDPLLWL